MFKAGAGSWIITPPVGTSLAGYFHDRVSTAVRDDLMAKAVVFDDGTTKAAIVVCDLCRVMRDEVEKAREIISEATGIPAGNIWISATHTHSGPETHPNKHVPINQAWIGRLPQMIADAAIRAHASLRPVTPRLAEEYEDRIAFNRRFRMKDGTVQFNPGKQNPEIIGPDGPIDPQLNVLRLDGPDGQPIAIIANYSLHVDVIGIEEISADFPGEMSRIVSSIYPNHPLVVFLQGTCGNINHLDVTSPDQQKGEAEMQRIARVLAGKVLAASELSRPMESGKVGVESEMLEIAYHPMTEALRERAAEIRRKEDASEIEIAQAVRIEDYDLDGKTADVEVQAIRVGDTAFVGAEGEYFVEYGLSIKEWSPFDQTFVGELANGSFGYIPTLDAFHPGTYETMPILSATLEPSAGVKIANSAGRLLRRLAG
ncbi:MAG: hypothetical protein KBC96_05135 [Armatimonadetes bacterium]|nr:hypothetical protein [Armatimonadota bacterium]